MSAALLREAAEVIRERAGKATPGPWGIGNRTTVATDVTQKGSGCFSYKSFVAEVDDFAREEDYEAVPAEYDADHIATWSPDVALLVADWLSLSADHAAGRGSGCGSCVGQAERVARRILGRES